jgi:5-formyltetrahydrofolate cyclo-ligase
MTKAELRKFYLNERLSLSDKDLEKFNAAICDNFFAQVDLQNIKVLHSFVPMLNTKEPDTWKIINKISQQIPHIKISLPKINLKSIEIENFYFDNEEQLKPNAWGIPEPEYGERTKTDDIDLVLVPMLIADRQGHRVGYGKGFYDKFLATCQPSCVSVGLCFYEPIDRIDDVNELDVPLKYCATPTKVHRFRYA